MCTSVSIFHATRNMSTVSERLKAVDKSMYAFYVRLREECKDVDSATAKFKVASMEFSKCQRVLGFVEKRAKRARMLYDMSVQNVNAHCPPTGPPSFRSVEERDAFLQAQIPLHDIRARCKKELDDSSAVLASIQAAVHEASENLELAKLELDLIQMY
jgi:hypothetical protein